MILPFPLGNGERNILGGNAKRAFNLAPVVSEVKTRRLAERTPARPPDPFDREKDRNLMDTVSFRDLSVAETDTKTMLAHAAQQGLSKALRGFSHRRCRRASLREHVLCRDHAIHRRPGDARSGEVSGLWLGRHQLGDLGWRLSESDGPRHTQPARSMQSRSRRRHIATSP